MRIKTAYLTGPALDWAVGDIEFKRLIAEGEHVKQWVLDAHNSGESDPYSTNWLFGGPIIEGEHLQSHWAGPVLGYAAMHPDCKKYSYGPTMLIAAMRCYVASRLGDEVTVPEALL